MDTQKSLKILLVDDLTSARKALIGLLKCLMLDTNVTECSNGSEALDQISKNVFDLVLSDLNMPDYDGIEILRKMREGSVNSQTPFVLITSDREPLAANSFLLENVSGFLMKPFGSHDLMLKITAALNEKN